MKHILAIVFVAIVTASPALAGVCNGVGGWTICTDDRGNQTSVQHMGGNSYQVQTYQKGQPPKTENFYNYNNNNDDDRN